MIIWNFVKKLDNSIKILAEALKTESVYKYQTVSTKSKELNVSLWDNNINMTYKI